MVSGIQAILESHKKFTREREWDQFQNPKNLSIALSVEASELAEIFMWLTETQSAFPNEKQLQAASEEMADVFIYLLRIAHELGVDLIAATNAKMIKNIEKHPIENGRSIAKALRE